MPCRSAHLINAPILLGLSFCLIFFALPGPGQGVDSGEKSAAPFSQRGFLPDIALILDFSYLARDRDDGQWLNTTNPANPADQPDLSTRGFHLNYLEMTLASAVDPYFNLSATLTYSGTTVAIEEAMAILTKLPLGLQLHVGKLKSAFGRINTQHEHVWNFSHLPLVLHHFFGDGLNEPGLRLSWLSPLPFYLQVALEALQGQNNSLFSSTQAHDSPLPGLWVGTAKTSFDIGQATAEFGASVARACRRSAGAPGQSPTWGPVQITWGLDATVKYFIDSYRMLSVQGEYLRGDRGSGAYLEAAWKWQSRMRCGLRWDWCGAPAGPYAAANEAPWRLSCMCELLPSEFSRLRLEYRYDHTRLLGAASFPCHEIELSLNLAVGAHGAHAF